MMSSTEMADDEFREAHRAADLLCSEKFRSYLPGRMLPMLLGRFRDDMAEAMGMELPPLHQPQLEIEKGDRARIADELRDKARAS